MSTYSTKAIILRRFLFREHDSRVLVFTPDRGKLELVVRGTQKEGSKLAGHIEPISEADILVVPGRRYDYLGSSIAENFFSGIKHDLEKLYYASRVMRLFDASVKLEFSDIRLYKFLQEYLNFLDKKLFSPLSSYSLPLARGGLGGVSGGGYFLPTSLELLDSAFALKLMTRLGYGPELNYCQTCGKSISGGGNYFDPKVSAIKCRKCGGKEALTVTDDCVKILRFMKKMNFENIACLRTNQAQRQEIKNIINCYLQYNLEDSFRS